jgi:hypothetical protein
MRRTIMIAAVATLATVLSGCLHFDVRHLSSDQFAGRNNNSTGGLAARAYVVERLRSTTTGPVPGGTGDAAYTQTFAQGANVIGVIPGTVHPDEYVLIGAHYDHHATCGTVAGDTICNGATDNAAGTAMVLELADRFAAEPPARSVAFVLWDAEEDGLLGSKYYVDNPVIPLAQTVAYLNLDIQGANLLPTLQPRTFAIGAESGGPVLQDVVTAAYGGTALQGTQLSGIFGLYRSDYAPFLGKQVPTVFFTDSTGPCYHTPKDDEFAVDWAKLDQQVTVLYATAETLARPGPGGGYVSPAWTTQPLTTHGDAIVLRQVITQSLPDWGRFPQSLIDGITPHIANLDRIVAEGPAAYDDTDQSQLLNAASSLVNMMTYGDCDPFLP